MKSQHATDFTKTILAGLAAVALMTPWPAFPQPAPQPTMAYRDPALERELVKLEDTWNDILMKGDAALLDPLVGDDYLQTDPEGAVTGKAQTLADLKSGDLKITSAVNDEYKVHVYGNSAVANYRARIKGSYRGMDLSGTYRETDTWVKRGDHWQCVAAQVTKMVERKQG